MCHSLFSQFQELVVELGHFFNVGVVNRAELLKKLQSFPFLQLGMYGFDIVLQIGLLLRVLRQTIDLFL